MRTLQEWLAVAGLAAGPLFRSISRHGHVQDRLSGIDVARVVKKLAERADVAGRRPAPRL